MELMTTALTSLQFHAKLVYIQSHIPQRFHLRHQILPPQQQQRINPHPIRPLMQKEDFCNRRTRQALARTDTDAHKYPCNN